MDAAISIRRTELLPGGLDDLIRESEAEGFRFLRRLRDDWCAGTNTFSAHGEALFTASDGVQLIAVCGLNQDPYADSQAARLRHLFVAAAYRRRRIASDLVEQALDLARLHFTSIRLRTDGPATALFYEAIGFTPVRARHATHVLPLMPGGAAAGS